MNNEQKKEYSKPEITIIEMGHEANLLNCSDAPNEPMCADWVGG